MTVCPKDTVCMINLLKSIFIIQSYSHSINVYINFLSIYLDIHVPACPEHFIEALFTGKNKDLADNTKRKN